MESLLIILAAAAAVTSALSYPTRPRFTIAASVLTAMVGAGAFAFIAFGPKDYMLRIPSSMTALLHPWIVGGLGSLLIILGVGGIIGCSARWLIGKRGR